MVKANKAKKVPEITKEQLVEIRDMLGFTNLTLGQELDYTTAAYQCKQIDNLVKGESKIRPVFVVALECLARRKNKLKEFNRIVSGETGA